MKKDIHPKEYRRVIFRDTASGERFLIPSTVASETTDTWTDGKKYPLVDIEVSSASHPFYTGEEKVIDTAGRVEKFKARLAQRASKTSKSAKSTQAKKKQPEATKKTKS